MKIYVDWNDRICDVDSTENPLLHELVVDDWLFGDITKNQIKCYRCVLDGFGRPSITLMVSADLFEQVGELDRKDAAEKQGSDMAIAEMTMVMAEMQSNSDMAVAELTMAMASLIPDAEGGTGNV